MAACWLSDMVNTSCLYLHPRHRPSKPKLRHAPPGSPVLKLVSRTLPRVHRSTMVRDGYSLLRVPTTFWHSGGMAALTVGFFPPPCAARVVAGVFNPGTFTWGPRNSATGHVSVSWIEQSSTSCQTVWSNVEWGSHSPSSQPLHARKNCQVLWWICHIRCTMSVPHQGLEDTVTVSRCVCHESLTSAWSWGNTHGLPRQWAWFHHSP